MALVVSRDTHDRFKVSVVENIRAYPDISPRVVVRRPSDKSRQSSKSDAGVRATYLNTLAILVNLLSASAFSIAAAFTSQFILMTTFADGLLLGAVLYGILVGVVCGDV